MHIACILSVNMHIACVISVNIYNAYFIIVARYAIALFLVIIIVSSRASSVFAFRFVVNQSPYSSNLSSINNVSTDLFPDACRLIAVITTDDIV